LIEFDLVLNPFKIAQINLNRCLALFMRATPISLFKTLQRVVQRHCSLALLCRTLLITVPLSPLP
jgi:hypothetical protein